jgi:crotonobetainyl-CoA:carnitine CoA-transferase CaiB-like acyl-CoA transferase
MDIVRGIRVVNLALNLPGPLAASRLARMGAEVVKVEPPAGDPMELYSAAWYREMAAGQELVRLDMKTPEGQTRCGELLAAADVLITSNRPSVLARLHLARETLHPRFPKLCQVAIFGYPEPRGDVAGHDLTYQAALGLLFPPSLPRTLLADMAGAERAVSSALGLLYARERFGRSGFAEVVLSDAAAEAAAPLSFGLTRPGGLFGGGSLEYNIYPARDGFVAVAALEPRFRERLLASLGGVHTAGEISAAFASRNADEWEQLGEELDIPIVKVIAAEGAS